jgi:hypothetical protein
MVSTKLCFIFVKSFFKQFSTVLLDLMRCLFYSVSCELPCDSSSHFSIDFVMDSITVLPSQMPKRVINNTYPNITSYVYTIFILCAIVDCKVVANFVTTLPAILSSIGKISLCAIKLPLFFVYYLSMSHPSR